MKLFNTCLDILKDIKIVLESIGEHEADDFLEAVSCAGRVYFSGAGRSLFAARSFAQRLYQCGLEVYVLGDTVIPPVGVGDILIACSCSGETLPALYAAERAKEAGCRVIAVTSKLSSRLAKSADMTVLVPLPVRTEYQQPLGSLFEQSALLFFDCIVALLMERRGLRGDDLKKRHGNLE